MTPESTDCEWCGARERHHRMIERTCRCGVFFTVATERSKQRFCARACQLDDYNETRRTKADSAAASKRSLAARRAERLRL